MKKNFNIKSVASKVQVSSAKHESNNLLKFLKPDVCCEWAVAIVGNATAQKSLIVG